MVKYRLIRDKEIFEIPDELVEVCDDRHEIIEFGSKELINIVMELKESDYRDLDLFADLLELLFHLGEISFIDYDTIQDYADKKLEEKGGYSKFLRKENR